MYFLTIDTKEENPEIAECYGPFSTVAELKIKNKDRQKLYPPQHYRHSISKVIQTLIPQYEWEETS